MAYQQSLSFLISKELNDGLFLAETFAVFEISQLGSSLNVEEYMKKAFISDKAEVLLCDELYLANVLHNMLNYMWVS